MSTVSHPSKRSTASSRRIAARIVRFAEELRALVQAATEEALRVEVSRSIRALELRPGRTGSAAARRKRPPAVRPRRRRAAHR